MRNLMRKVYAKYEVLKEEKGATMIEYTLLAALISVIAIVAITAVGVDVNRIFEAIQGKLDPIPTP